MTAIADRPADAAVPPDASPLALDVSFGPVATLSADLMPDEIVVKRRLAYLKRRLVFVMVALVALIVLGDMLVRQQTNSAQGGLAAANAQITTLTGQLDHFNAMLATQSETEAIRTQLDGVMGTDVAWPHLLGELARPAPSGLHLTSISAQVDDPSATGAAADPTAVDPDATGSLTLIGDAPSWTDVASYVRGLSAVKGFTAVNPSTVSNGATGPGASKSGSLTFTITLDLTSGALSNRYVATPPDPAASSTATGTAAATGTTSATGTNAPSSPVDTQTTGSSHSSTAHTATHHTSSSSHHHVHHKQTPNSVMSRGTGLNQNVQEAS